MSVKNGLIKSKIDRDRCPQCGAFLSKVKGESLAFSLGLADADFTCKNPRCLSKNQKG